MVTLFLHKKLAYNKLEQLNTKKTNYNSNLSFLLIIIRQITSVICLFYTCLCLIFEELGSGMCHLTFIFHIIIIAMYDFVPTFYSNPILFSLHKKYESLWGSMAIWYFFTQKLLNEFIRKFTKNIRNTQGLLFTAIYDIQAGGTAGLYIKVSLTIFPSTLNIK